MGGVPGLPPYHHQTREVAVANKTGRSEKTGNFFFNDKFNSYKGKQGYDSKGHKVGKPAAAKAAPKTTPRKGK